MHVILLAAGRSSRLNPISDKNLLEFCGKTLIEHQVTSLKKAGFENITIVGNIDNLEQIKKIFKDYENMSFAAQKDLNDGMAGGILAGSELVVGDEVVIMSTNDVFSPKLFSDVLLEAKSDVDAILVGKKMEKYFPGGYIELDENDFITNIIEKPGEGNEPSDLVNIVFHVYKKFTEFLDFIKENNSDKDDKYEVALDNYIKKHKAKIKAFKYDGFWQAIKYPWHILKLMNYFLENQNPQVDPSADIAKTAIIRGNVVIEKNVKIFDNVVIQGPAYIGEGVVIANNSLIRGSMIGKNSVIGFTTEVARSYLNYDVWTHSNYIGDSILDYNVSFGSGTVLGNLRFDEKNVKVNIKDQRIDSGINKLGAIIGNGVRFGINVSTNPGVKIGQNTFVGGGVMVDKDIEGGKVSILKQELKIVNNIINIGVDERNNMKKELKK